MKRHNWMEMNNRYNTRKILLFRCHSIYGFMSTNFGELSVHDELTQWCELNIYDAGFIKYVKPFHLAVYIKIFSTFSINHFAIHTRLSFVVVRTSVEFTKSTQTCSRIHYYRIYSFIYVNVCRCRTIRRRGRVRKKKSRDEKRGFGWGTVCVAASIYWIYLFARTLFFLQAHSIPVDDVIWWVMRTVCVYRASYMKYERIEH